MKNLKIHDNITYSDNFKKIITFYLFECPVENVSARGYEFSDLGWNNTYLKKFYYMMKDLSNIKENNWILCNINEISQYIANINKKEQYIVCNDGNGKTKSIFYAIRNSFAHGSFEIYNQEHKIYYLLKNVDKGILKAQINVEEDTLIKWMNLFNTNPEYLTTKNKINSVIDKVNKNKW